MMTMPLPLHNPLFASVILGQAALEPQGADSAGVVETLSATGGQVKTLVGEAMTGNPAALQQLAVNHLLPAVFMLLLLVLSYFVGKMLSGWVSRPLSRRVDPTVGNFFGKLVFYAIMVSAVLGVLGRMGVSVASFAAVIAAMGFAIGLAFQGTLSNFAAGLMLLIFRPFKVGDVVGAAGITAKVAEIDLFTTKFDTFDNRRIIVPNGDIFGSTIENATFHRHRRADINVGTAYAADLDHTREVLTAAVESVDGRVEGDNRGFQIFLKDLGDSSIQWVVRVWYPTADFWSKREALVRAIKNHLDQAQIAIPFPQREVWVRKEGSEQS
ncbi:MAG: mechanosensitive ion channel domain-containing protein [Algisphaera sp.]